MIRDRKACTRQRREARRKADRAPVVEPVCDAEHDAGTESVTGAEGTLDVDLEGRKAPARARATGVHERFLSGAEDRERLALGGVLGERLFVVQARVLARPVLTRNDRGCGVRVELAIMLAVDGDVRLSEAPRE